MFLLLQDTDYLFWMKELYRSWRRAETDKPNHQCQILAISSQVPQNWTICRLNECRHMQQRSAHTVDTLTLNASCKQQTTAYWTMDIL